MALTFKTIALLALVVGVGMGVAFGAGVAYGHGNPKTVQGGLTQAQISSMLGITGTTGGTGAAGGGGTGTGGGAGAAAAALANTTTGKITAIQGQTVSVQTAQGTTVKINLASTTTVSKVSTGTATDLAAGMTVVANGTKKDDGSFDATSISQVPTELQSLISFGGGNRAATTGTPAAPSASATPGR